MSQTITITIDKRPVTLTARDVGELVRIARNIDRDVTIPRSIHNRPMLNVMRSVFVPLAKWLDNHGPEVVRKP